MRPACVHDVRVDDTLLNIILRSSVFARAILDLTAGTEMPMILAMSLIEQSCVRRNNITVLSGARSRRIDSVSNCSRSRFIRSCSGVARASAGSHVLDVISSVGFGASGSSIPRLLRRLISAEFSAIRVIHVENVDLPSNRLRCKNALRVASCTASSASCQFLVTRFIWSVSLYV